MGSRVPLQAAFGDVAEHDPERWEHLQGKLDAAGGEYVVHSGVSIYCTDPDGARNELIADRSARCTGLRLLKQTVNFDAPDVYHLYYGDASGTPASILTFFPWKGVPAGHNGAGLTTATATRTAW